MRTSPACARLLKYCRRRCWRRWRVQRAGGQPKPTKKIALTLRLDPDIVAAFKREGPGWQTRINVVLRKAVQ